MATPTIRRSDDLTVRRPDGPTVRRSAPGLPGAVSDAIRTLRLPLLAGPLLVHACLNPAHSTLQFVLARILGDIAVPAFFFISGILYFASFDGTARCWLRKLANRVRSLAVPYLLWNLIGFFLLAYAVPMVAKGDFLRSFWAVRVAYRPIASAPVDGPLYFIKGLYFLAIGAPALYFALRRRFLAWLAPAVLLFWVVSPLAALEGRMAVIALAFFSCGGYLAIYRPAAFERIATSRRAALAAVAVFLAVSALNLGLHLANVGSPALLRAKFPCPSARKHRRRNTLLLRRGGGTGRRLDCAAAAPFAGLRDVPLLLVRPHHGLYAAGVASAARRLGRNLSSCRGDDVRRLAGTLSHAGASGASAAAHPHRRPRLGAPALTPCNPPRQSSTSDIEKAFRCAAAALTAYAASRRPWAGKPCRSTPTRRSIRDVCALRLTVCARSAASGPYPACLLRSAGAPGMAQSANRQMRRDGDRESRIP